VLEAIEDSKEAILSQDDLPLPPKSTAIAGINGNPHFILTSSLQP